MVQTPMPDWAVPAFEEVAAMRRSAGAATGDSHELGIMRALDWAAGVYPVTPLTGFRDAPTLPRAMAERLCAYELVTGRAAADEEYERFGYLPLAPEETLMNPANGGGVWEALTWLLGESDHVPGSRFRSGGVAG